jgi:hypothetical protein
MYGHPGAQGSSHGYLAYPDDAYLLPNGQTSVADIINCRVLWLNRVKRIVRSIGSAGKWMHDPPRALLQPNEDTPLADGGVLVTEIGGWLDRFDRQGRLKWSIARRPTTTPTPSCCQTATSSSRASTHQGGSTSSRHEAASSGATVLVRAVALSTARRLPSCCRTESSPSPTTGIPAWFSSIAVHGASSGSTVTSAPQQRIPGI